MDVSELIRERLLKKDKKFFCNDNISDVIQEGELDLLQKEVEQKFEKVLRALVIDIDQDHNTKETAKRWAKMAVTEIFNGRYVQQPDTTAFPNVTSYDQLYVTGPISVRSVCAHHFQPITGRCWIGVYPGKNVIGLSKFNRLVDWIATRPHIQEELTIQVADLIEQETKAAGIAVVIKAAHGCLLHRGVKEPESDMVTSVMRGQLRNSEPLKQEFLSLMNNMKGHQN